MMQKWAVFRLISKFSLNISFLRIFFMKKRSKVRNIRKKYRRQIMLTTPIQMEHNQNRVAAINHRCAIRINFMTILDFFVSH